MDKLKFEDVSGKQYEVSLHNHKGDVYYSADEILIILGYTKTRSNTALPKVQVLYNKESKLREEINHCMIKKDFRYYVNMKGIKGIYNYLKDVNPYYLTHWDIIESLIKASGKLKSETPVKEVEIVTQVVSQPVEIKDTLVELKDFLVENNINEFQYNSTNEAFDMKVGFIPLKNIKTVSDMDEIMVAFKTLGRFS